MSLPEGVPIYLPSRKYNRLTKVGVVRGEVYYTPRRHYHFFRKFNGFGIGANVLQELLNRNIAYLVFRFYQHDTITDFGLSMEDFMLLASSWKDSSPFSRVSEEQLICDVKYMQRTMIK